MARILRSSRRALVALLGAVLVLAVAAPAGAQAACDGNDCTEPGHWQGQVSAAEAPPVSAAASPTPFVAPVGPVPSMVGFGNVSTTDNEAQFATGAVRPPLVPGAPQRYDTTTVRQVTFTNDGLQALVSTSRSTAPREISVVTHPGTAAQGAGASIGLDQFSGEGGASYVAFPRAVGLTPDGTAGIAAIDSQGAVVLTRTESGEYVVDDAVQSGGTNEAGAPHAPGFLRDPSGSMNTVDGLAVGGPRADGTSLVVARDADSIRVIQGLGDGAVPTLGGLLADLPALSGLVEEGGNSGIAFSPTDPEKAVVATSMGFAVLLLDDPDAPVLTAQTEVGIPGRSVAVLPDGDTVAVATASAVHFFRGLRTADSPTSTLTATGAAPIAFAGNNVRALVATTRNDLVVGYVSGGAPKLALVQAVTTVPTRDVAADLTYPGTGFRTNSMSGFDGLDGYRFAARDGGIFNFGADPFHGSLGAVALNQPINGMAALPGPSDGYWMSASDGGVFSFGAAEFFGSTGNLVLNQPIVGMARTPTGKGYWLVATDGGIFSFGDAQFFGSTGGLVLNQPIVGMAATPSGQGYWLIARDGGVFAFGDAEFFGSTGGLVLNQPIVGGAATPSGNGYWFVATDGGIFTFGDAEFFGSTGGLVLNQPIVAMLATPNGQGYWLVASDGGVFSFGNAPFLGGTGHIVLNQPIFAASR